MKSPAAPPKPATDSPSEPAPATDSERPATDSERPATDSERVSIGHRVGIYAVLAIIGALADLASKQAVFAWRGLPGQREIWWIIEPYFGIETAVNPGALFGMGAGQGTLFALLSIVALVGIWIWLFRFGAAVSLWLTIALGLVTGGIFGNLYDRLGFWWNPDLPTAWKSGVRDWILIRYNAEWTWPNFNIADSLLVVGAIMLLLQSIFFAPDDTQE